MSNRVVTGGGRDMDSRGREIELKVWGLLHLHILQRVLHQYHLLQYRVISAHHSCRHRQVLSDNNIRGLRALAVARAEVVVGDRGMDRDRVCHLDQDLSLRVGSADSQVISSVRVHD
ncbi:hypothetical protein Scep_001958 [Stephania cephalantha]|uniref:Uncharacterized protein n=1 Tax=Stephania cephalantha TaxID=152367 RepID=A0AAP0L914_9MAGN